MKRLILASQSPRRREILRAAGLTFEVRAPGVEEVLRPEETPRDYVRRLALDKARAVSLAGDELVLSADTVVVLNQHVLEKPRDPEDAARMLGLLADCEHQVITGICLRTETAEQLDLAITRVWFGPLTRGEIEEYVASGEPFDKAGAYAIQGLASKFIQRIEGCYFNVVGLPVALVYSHLKNLGFPS